MENISVKHNPDEQEFTVDIKGSGGELAYSLPQDDVIDFSHTYVDEDLRNQGVANELIKTGLQYAQDHNLKVVASCPAVSAYIRRHPEWQKLLK
ncbi:GNAT family N-acetyltransferase [Adhaeribacter pallidiroseus]|nr:GNAT family N-acetyltransferase [Adhaeribacter pallidiroseus]